MAGTKRSTEGMEILNKNELLEAIKKLPTQRDRALVTFLYLTGARVSEVLGCIKVIKGKKYQIRPLKKSDIEVKPDEDLILINNVPCLKRRDQLPRRTIPIIISEEYPFLELFWPHYSQLQDNKPLFDIGRVRAWIIINKEMGLFTHYFIHERCTHLVKNMQFSDTELMLFRGWSSTMMASRYTHLNYRDLVDKMRYHSD